MSGQTPPNQIPRATDRSSARRGVQNATLLVLVMMVVSASPGVFKCGVQTGPFGVDRVAEFRNREDGEGHLVKADGRPEHLPAAKPTFKPFHQIVRGCGACITPALPFGLLNAPVVADARSTSGRRMTMLTLALPPPLG